MIRRTLLVLSAAIIIAGCVSRSDIPGTYTEGGIGSPFYAEVTHAKEGEKPRVYLFGKVAFYEAFLKTKEVPENKQKRFIRKGVNNETVVVHDLDGVELKENPQYAQRLLAKYQARHGLNGATAPVADAPAAAPVAPAPAVVPAAEAPPAPAAK